MFSTHALTDPPPAKKRKLTHRELLVSLLSQTEELEEDIVGTLEAISKRLERIRRHLGKTKAEFANLNEEGCEELLGSVTADVQKLTEMQDQLSNVCTTHPYCAGCNDPYGFQLNQQAHMGGCMDDSSDEGGSGEDE